MRSLKSTLDCFLFVAVVLPLNLGYYWCLLKWITLTVFLLFFDFFFYGPRLFLCLPLLNLVAELLEWPRWTEAAWELRC